MLVLNKYLIGKDTTLTEELTVYKKKCLYLDSRVDILQKLDSNNISLLEVKEKKYNLQKDISDSYKSDYEKQKKKTFGLVLKGVVIGLPLGGLLFHFL